MKPPAYRFKNFTQPFRGALAIVWLAFFALGASTVLGQTALRDSGPPAANTGTQEAWRLPDDQLDSLVAPIALYPDPLLSQTLVASTYPLEIIQLQQWMERNKTLQGQALADAVQKQNWDPSIQSMVAVPDVIERLAGNIQWTTDLGNAFLAQPEDVMAAIQRMRAKARGTNVLVSNSQQTVGTEVVEGGQQVIVIQQANPKVVYIPSYDPVVVYGAPVYPYPSYVYPGYVPGTGLAFGVGIALGAAWGNGWGYNCGWHGGNVNVNINNNYVRHYNNVNNINNINGSKWAHQPVHRGGTPYSRGGVSGASGATRPNTRASTQPTARPSTQPNTRASTQPNTRPSTQPTTRPSTQPNTRPTTRPSSNSIGGRSVSSGSSTSRSAFDSSSYSGSSARASSSRGSSSMRSSGGGRSGGGGRRR